MNRKPRHFTGWKLAALALIAGIAGAGRTKARAEDVTARVQTVQNGEIRTEVSRSGAGDETIYAVQLANETGQGQNLGVIDIVLRPDKPIRDGTPYMIGADAQEPDGHMEQLVAGQPAKNDFSNMYVMFKQGEADYRLVGVISWRTFLCKVSTKGGSIQIEGDGDNRLLAARKGVAFEKVVSLRNRSWQDLLDRYAELMRKENNIAGVPDVAWRGWSTWDYYGRKFLSADVDENVAAMQELNVPMNIIQIDGGWWKERGDYLATRDDLPGGIKALAEKIHRAGYKVGLHFDGFRATKSAEIAKQHPEYFLHEAKGGLLALKPNSRESFLIWDYSHPGAAEYIRGVMKNARENWGVDYFKIDFMRNGLDKGIGYLPVTSLERFRMGLSAMKEGMGPGAYFLACGANFGTVVGLVDGNRTGQDISPDYHTVRAKVKHTSGSYYLHRRVFNVDSDYLVFRSAAESDGRDAKRASLTEEQAAMWANYVVIYGNARFDSDKVPLLRAKKKELIQRAFQLPFFDRVIPMDMWDHYKTEIDAPCFYLADAGNGVIGLGLFNWEDTNASFTVSGFTQEASFQEFGGQAKAASSNGAFTVPLNGTHSVLLQYKGTESFDTLRRQLKLLVNR